MLFYVATKWGFMQAPHIRECNRDVRLAYPFESFQAADEAGRAVFGNTYYAILSNSSGIECFGDTKDTIIAMKQLANLFNSFKTVDVKNYEEAIELVKTYWDLFEAFNAFDDLIDRIEAYEKETCPI